MLHYGEEAKKKGDATIKALIDDAVVGTSVTVVLIGSQTAARKYVNYEIRKSLDLNRGVIGVRINDIKDQNGKTDPIGLVPTDLMQSGLPVYTYEYGKLGGWIEEAYQKATTGS